MQRVRLTAAIVPVCAAMLFLLFVLFFGCFLESYQCLVPKLGKMVAEKRQSFGIQFVNAPRAIAAVTHQARLF